MSHPPPRLTGMVLFGVVLPLLLGACSEEELPPGQNSRPPGQRYRLVPIAEGLDHPWSLAFLPNGDLLVSERVGRLQVVRQGELGATPIEGIPSVHMEGQGGLLDVVAHPKYETTPMVYFSFAKSNQGTNSATIAVARGRLEENRLSEVEELFEAEAWNDEPYHFGSRIVFDENGYLFVTVGDRYVDPESSSLANHPAQRLTSHAGKVLRLLENGRAPTDNPFADDNMALPEIWSYGHRNPQGILVHPETGDVWLTEHGPRGGDEVNQILKGRNYGWPIVGYGVDYDGTSFHRDAPALELEQPSFFWTPSIGPTGLTIYQGDKFPHWRGNLFSGAIAGRGFVRITLDGRRVIGTEVLSEQLRRVRDVQTGPEGYIYIVVDPRDEASGVVYRVEPLP